MKVHLNFTQICGHTLSAICNYIQLYATTNEEVNKRLFFTNQNLRIFLIMVFANLSANNQSNASCQSRALQLIEEKTILNNQPFAIRNYFPKQNNLQQSLPNYNGFQRPHEQIFFQKRSTSNLNGGKFKNIVLQNKATPMSTTLA